MGLFPEADRRTIAEEFAREAATPAPLSFSEGVSAVMEDVGLTGRSDSMARQVQDSATRSLARLTDLTGEQFDFPTYGWSNRQSLAAVGLLNGRADAIRALRSDENGPPDPFLKTGDEIQQDATQRVEQARAQSARAGFGAQIVGGIAGAATDPLNLALLPLGVARAETLAAKVVGEAVVGAFAGAAMETASLSAKDFAGVTPTAGEAAANIGLNAVFGAGIGALTHGVDLYARRRAMVSAIDQGIAEGRIQPTRDIVTARDAIQDHLDTVRPMATPEAEGAHLDAVAAATDVLRAEHPIEQAAALRRLGEKAAAWEDRSVSADAIDALKARDADPRNLPAADEIAAMSRELEAADKQAVASAAQPRERLRQTLLAEIRRRGGMSTPTNFLEGRMLGQSGLLTAIRRDGMGIDQWHASLLEEGAIPERTTLDEFFEMLTSGTKNMEAQDAQAARIFEKESGLQSMRDYIGQLEEARAFLRGPDGPEPTLGQVEDYLADPQGYIRRYTDDAIQAALRAERANPTPTIVEQPTDVLRAEHPIEQAAALRRLGEKEVEVSKATEGVLSPQGRERIAEMMRGAFPSKDAQQQADMVEILSRIAENTARSRGQTADELLQGLEIRGSTADEIGADALFQKSAKMTPEQKEAARQAALAQKVPGFRAVVRNLTPEERKLVAAESAEKLVALSRELPSADEMATVAIAGEAKRGWYERSVQALQEIFGEDAPRFAGLLAALSPQTSVENNLLNALMVWKNWIAAERPIDYASILRIAGESVQGNKGADSVLEAWQNNMYRALSWDFSKGDLKISGPKVNSFMLNLLGHVDEVTNDAWMANYSGVDQGLFSGANRNDASFPELRTEKGPAKIGGKSWGYLAMSGRTREAARRALALTGSKWSPAEVQETVWSWAKALYEKQDKLNRGAVDILQSGDLTDADIGSVPDFADLFTSGDIYERILADAGYSEEIIRLRGRSPSRGDFSPDGRTASAAGDASEARGPAAGNRDEHLTRAARRLEELRRFRQADSNGAGSIYLSDGRIFARERGRGDLGGSLRSAAHGRGLAGGVTPAKFARIAAENRAAHRFGTSVDIFDAKGYGDHTLILLEKGKRNVTVSISPDGEIGSVTKSPSATKLDVRAAMESAALAQKGTWLNAFDTILPAKYADLGYKAVARIPWDEAKAPTGWDHAAYGAKSKRFPDGRPDVVFMRHVGGEQKYKHKEVPLVSSYDEATALAKGEPPLAAAAVGTLAQQDSDVLRGALEWQSAERAILHLTQDANVTTPLHEFAHWFRRLLDPEDARIAEDWLGVEGGAWSRNHEEMFAEGFEKYMAEGIAPTPQLEGVFERFRAWISQIANRLYRTGVELTPAARQLFDRLLARDPEREIAVRQQRRARIDAAVAAERANPTQPLVEQPIDAPVTRSLPDPMADEADAYFRSILEDDPDIEIAMDFDGVPAVGRAADIMADFDRQLAELGETTDCILGVVE